MEQLRSNYNFLMLNHMPRIMNIMQILNMMVYGLANNQPVYFVLAISSLQKSIRFSPKKLVTKWFSTLLRAVLRARYHVILIIVSLLVFLSGWFMITTLFILASLALAILATCLLVAYKTRVPAHRIPLMIFHKLGNYFSKWCCYPPVCTTVHT
jgi:hypothetical protein